MGSVQAPDESRANIRASTQRGRCFRCQHGRVPPSVLVVDDHADFRAAARALLAAHGWSVLGETADVRSTVAEVRRLRPDLVVIDVGLSPDDPEGDGIDLAHLLAGIEPPPSVVLVSARGRASYGARLDEAPALGFVPKADLSARRLSELLDAR